MQKRGRIIAGCLIVAAIGLFVVFTCSGRKPYKDLEASDIVSATVHLIPPDKTIQIAQVQDLVEYLNEIVIYHKDNTYTEYSGQAVVFTLAMADGSKEEIMAYNPFVVRNGTGYRAKYEPCEKLNQYANALLNREEQMD